MKRRHWIRRITVLAAGVSVVLATWPQPASEEGNRLQHQRPPLSVDATANVDVHVVACCSRGVEPAG